MPTRYEAREADRAALFVPLRPDQLMKFFKGPEFDDWRIVLDETWEPGDHWATRWNWEFMPRENDRHNHTPLRPYATRNDVFTALIMPDYLRLSISEKWAADGVDLYGLVDPARTKPEIMEFASRLGSPGPEFWFELFGPRSLEVLELFHRLPDEGPHHYDYPTAFLPGLSQTRKQMFDLGYADRQRAWTVAKRLTGYDYVADAALVLAHEDLFAARDHTAFQPGVKELSNDVFRTLTLGWRRNYSGRWPGSARGKVTQFPMPHLEPRGMWRAYDRILDNWSSTTRQRGPTDHEVSRSPWLYREVKQPLPIPTP